VLAAEEGIDVDFAGHDGDDLVRISLHGWSVENVCSRGYKPDALRKSKTI
jgi:hypothetical protein